MIDRETRSKLCSWHDPEKVKAAFEPITLKGIEGADDPNAVRHMLQAQPGHFINHSRIQTDDGQVMIQKCSSFPTVSDPSLDGKSPYGVVKEASGGLREVVLGVMYADMQTYRDEQVERAPDLEALVSAAIAHGIHKVFDYLLEVRPDLAPALRSAAALGAAGDGVGFIFSQFHTDVQHEVPRLATTDGYVAPSAIPDEEFQNVHGPNDYNTSMNYGDVTDPSHITECPFKNAAKVIHTEVGRFLVDTSAQLSQNPALAALPINDIHRNIRQGPLDNSAVAPTCDSFSQVLGSAINQKLLES